MRNGPEENEPGRVEWTDHQCAQRLMSGRHAWPASAPRAPPVCLVLGTGEPEMNEPHPWPQGSRGVWGEGQTGLRYKRLISRHTGRAGGYHAQPVGIAEGFLVEAMPKWGLAGQVGIS